MFMRDLECSRVSLFVGGLGVGEGAGWSAFSVGVLFVDELEDPVTDSGSHSHSEFDSKPLDSIVCKAYKIQATFNTGFHTTLT